MISRVIHGHSRPDKEDASDEFELIDTGDAALDKSSLAKILGWLQPTDFEDDSSECNRHLSSQAPGTGLWICETDSYRRWHDSADHASLWVKGNVETLGILLDAGCDPNAINDGKIVPIHYEQEKQIRHALLCACFNDEYSQAGEGNVPLALLLLQRGADLYSRLANSEILMHHIFEFAEHAIAKRLVDSPDLLDLDRRDHLGRTILHAACRSPHSEPRYSNRQDDSSTASVLLKLISYSPKVDLGAIDNEGKTMLHHLMQNVDMSDNLILEVLKHPIGLKLVDLKDNDGYTAMHYALKSLRPALVEALLSIGANLLSPDPTGATAAHHISSQCLRTRKPSRHIWRDDDESSEFYPECLRLWQKFVAQGGDIDSRDQAGNTPLMACCAAPRMAPTYHQEQRNEMLGRTCHLEVYNKYFAHADVFARNNAGQSVLHVIANRVKVDHYYEKGKNVQPEHDARLFEFMVKKGLDPLEEDQEGRTALDYAAAREQKSILELYRYKS